MRKLITQKQRLAGLILAIALCLFQYADVLAQGRAVTGTVKDGGGEVLAGVSVKIKGTSRGASTDVAGKFRILLDEGQKILVFSYLGFQDKEIVIKDQADITVTLTESASQLNEVVVVGYGAVRRPDLTGSVGSVKMNDLQQAPVKSFDEALAGRVAGVQVTSSEGQPGASSDIVIRGYNSVNGVNYPLVVVDGFPMENANDANISSNVLNTIDPNDIESIDILKDASATAIYGARGANGVIMVTTKRGKTGTSTITYNGYAGYQENKKRMEVLSPYEFVKLQNEINPVDTRNNYLDNGKLTVDDYRNIKGINWEDLITRNAFMQNHYLSLNGGNERTKYSASLSTIGQDGIIMNTGYQRTQGKFTLDQAVSNKLNVGLNANYSYNKNYGTSASASTYQNEINLLFSVWAYRPVTGIDNSDLLTEPVDPETAGTSDFRFNPILTTENEERINSGNTFNANGFAEYAITSALKLRVAGGVNRSTRDYEMFNGPFSRSGSAANYAVNGGKTNYNTNSWLNYNTLTYEKRFNKNHYINAVGGFNIESQQSIVFGATATNLPNASLGLSGLDQGNPNSITSLTTKASMASFLGRVNYKLTDRYLFTASVRADGTSRFRDDNRWGYFPAGAFAWLLSNEPFMKKQNVVSNAKLRTSWGLTGNNQIGNFATFSGITNDNTSGYMFNNIDNKGAYYSSLGNRGLKWETTEQIDLGLDLGFFKERLSLAADIYRKKTRDLLLNAQLSPSTGFASSYKNIGSTQNQGLELSLSAVALDKKFKWNTSFNISFNRNKLLGLTENQNYMTSTQYWGDDWRTIPGYIALLDQPISQFYGLIWDGVYGYDDFIQSGSTYVLKPDVTANGESRANVKPGDIKYKDLNGDLLVDDKDKTVIGQPYPKHIGGFTNNFSYKGFDLSVFMQWSYGNDVLNANRIMLESGYKYNTNQFASYANRWTPENQGSDIPAVLGTTLKTYSTRVIEDGSFLRLKTVSFGYNLPSGLLKQLKVKTARVYVTAQNLHTWTNYSGYDPEVAVRNSALTPGFDYSAYPRARTLTFGINTSF